MVNAAWDAASIASESFSSTSTGDNSDESFEDSSSEEESSGSEDETENDDSSYAYSSDQAGFDDEPVVGGGTSKQEDIESGYGSTPTTSQKEESKIKRSKAVKVVASLCCFCIILVVILGSVLGIKKKDDNNGPTMAPTTLPITTPSTIPTRLFPTPPPEPSISMPTTTNLEDPEEFLLVASGDNYFDGSSNSASQINNGDLDTLLLRRNGFVMIEYNVSELAAIILDATTIPDDTRVPSAILRLVPVRGSDDGAANITVASLLVALPAPLETLHNSFPLPPNGSMSPKPAVHSILDISASTIVDIDITSFLFPPIPLEEEEEEDAIIRRMQQKAVTFLDHLTFVLQLTDTSGSIVFESRESSGNGPEIIISLRPASWNSHNTCESYHALLQGDPTTTTTTTTNSNSNSNNISSVVARGNTLEDGVEKSPDGRPTPVDYFVSSDSNTEHVILPQPPAVNWQEFDNRTDCPHEDPNAVSWFTEFPSLSPGDNVAIPDNTIMIIDKSIRTILGIITIPSNSTLVFAEDPSGITMDIQGMIVQGSLIAGSEGCRYETPLTITLHGSRPSQEDITDDTLPKSYKGIDIDGGTLQLHGKRYYRTWTRLSRRAYPGDYYLYLQDEVNWEAGQEIVLITTAMRDSREWHQNEIFVLSCVQTKDLPPAHPEVKSIVYLDSMVQHDHIARPEYQAEVGLLTRTIKIQGAGPDSEPMDVSPTHCQINKSPGQATFGYDSVPCPDTFLTGYGGHVIVHNNGKGFVEGVELYRMGQTNVLGRYPMHFHLLGGDCAGCYFKDSSIHHSFYRCLSIHGTSDIIASENVGYDIIGYCYYLEDGVEENNTLSYNLAAHVHFIGSPAIGVGQQTPHIPQSLDLTLPADITASGFYITNLHNNIVGNVAVGGWSGFAIPILKSPIGSHKDVDLDPSSRTTLLFDGNTAHSTGQFWGSAAAFYTGGVLYYEGDILTYNAGRPDQRHGRSPCVQDQETGACLHAWNRLTNTKVFLIPGAGIGSWTGRFDVIDYEAHDTGISLNVLEMGFGINNMVMGCRTGEILSLPVQRADLIPANGFAWYDTVQEHIMTNSTFRNCGFKSVEWDQYDASETRGCDSNIFNGCSTLSSVWGFVTHSNLHNPEIMQATRNITYDSVGRRFRYSSSVDSISGRTQNWMDVDGSVSGLNETTIIGSGLSSAGNWWNVDDNVVPDVQAPLYFIQKNNGPARGLAHIHLSWDESLHSTVDITSCGNGGGILDCLAVGRIRHLGSKFNSLNDPQGGLPITANADMAGLVGGYGWLLKLNEGAPHTLNITQIEVMPETPLILSVAYPLGTNFTIKARAFYCVPSCNKACEESFSRVDTLEEVRKSEGNVYYFDEFTGLLSLRVIMFPAFFTGLPSWKLWDFTDIGHDGSGFALNRFERDGVLLPKMGWTQRIEIAADCTRSGAYCEGVVSPSDAFDNVCSSEDFVQHSYDRCCHVDNESNCEYAYSRSDAPTTAPTNSVSPTLYVGNIIENGDFEEGSTLCPWVKKGTSMAELHTVDAFQGSQAALISQRTQPWAGLLQDITEKFKFNVTYSFKAAAKILSDDGTYLKVAFRVTYDRPNDPSYLASVYYSSTFPSNAWTEFETTFIFANTELEPVVDIVLYFETPSGRTDDFLVDFVSMEALTEAIQ